MERSARIVPVIASDKSYATIYSYGTGKVVTGKLMKNSEGFVRAVRPWNEDGSLANEEKLAE